MSNILEKLYKIDKKNMLKRKTFILRYSRRKKTYRQCPLLKALLTARYANVLNAEIKAAVRHLTDLIDTF